MKRQVRTEKDIPWLPKPGEGRLYLTDELPPEGTASTAFAFAFDEDRILLTRLRNRGWDIPGGALEPGENAAKAAVREVWEETSARITILTLIGTQELELFGPKPEGYKWPYPLSVQVCFLAKIVKIEPFRKNDESTERGFFLPSNARRVPTMLNHIELYEEALRMWRESNSRRR
jgi:8-oxo-dGTP diphosphatase